MSNLPQQITIDQYTADGVEDTYIYAFLIPTENDIAVYLTPSGETPNAVDDLQTLNVDYTVTGEGNTAGGTVVFTTPPTLGDTVTLSRNIQFSINTNFSNAQTISGVNLDTAFQRVTLMAQQLNSFYQYRGLQYIINSYIPPATTPTQLPVLADQEVWQGTAGGEVIAVTFDENVDVSALRSQLASQTQGGDGAQLIGYYDEYFNVGQTLDTFLNALPTYIADVVSALVPATGFQTGDVKPSMNPIALSGWIVWANGSIGSATSGASIRANADTQPLFELLWNNTTNGNCPVSGGRGANATADFVANKALTLPQTNGRALVNLQSTYLLGEVFGSADVTLALTQIPAHDHTGSIVALTSGQNYSPPVSPYVLHNNIATATVVNHTLNIASEGGGLAHENRQPSTAVYYHVKL